VVFRILTVFFSAVDVLGRRISRGLIVAGVLAAGSGLFDLRGEESRPASRDYLLLPGDIVRVQVFQEPDLDRELRVSQDGELTFPLIGRVSAKERTLSQLEETVRAAYDRDFLVNPQITIVIVKYGPRAVKVLGMVNQPQAVEFPPEQSMTVLDAISRAGGFNRLADRRRVRLTRTFADGHTESFTINADDLISGGSKEQWVVQRDDVIYVPERVL